MILTSDLAS